MKFIKKLNSKGFGHLDLLIVIVVVAAVAASGFLVYQHHHKASVAHAGSYTNLGGAYGVEVYACKTYVNAFGGVDNVTLLFAKKAGTSPVTYTAYDYRGHAVEEQSSSNVYWAGVVGSKTVNSSTYYGDKFQATLDSPVVTGGTWSTGLKSPSSVVNCQ